MKKIFLIILIFFAIIGASFLLFAPKENSNEAQIAATIFPIYDIVVNITEGTPLETTLILPPGASPHTFEPTPSLIQDLQSTSTVFAVGAGSDDWIDPIIESLPAEKTTLSHAVNLYDFPEHGMVEEDHEHEEEEVDHDHDTDTEEEGHIHVHTGVDPHYWLDAENGILIADAVAAQLSEIYPEYAAIFAENAESYDAELTALDQELTENFAQVSEHKMITLHNAWQYFARAYGFEIITTFTPSPGREPTPQYIAEIEEIVKDSGVSVIYSEPQLGDAGLASLAQDLDLEIRYLDPLGGIETRDSYINLLKYNAHVIQQ